jgi:nitroreductase
MDTLDRIATKVEVREFADGPVSSDVKLKILEAARMTGSSMNTQHWRFILVQDGANLRRLASDSISGRWVGGSSFAVLVLTDPRVPGYMIDTGRAVQDMQLAAWDQGVGSGIYTGVDEQKLRRDFEIPDHLKPTACLGFGYPAKKVTGKRKSRKPLEEIAFSESYGRKLELGRVSAP